MIKYEQNFSYNGRGDAKPLETWSDFSSIQYVKYGLQCGISFIDAEKS